MEPNPYVGFLPSGLRAAARDPEETWWEWQGHRVHVARARNPGSRSRLLVVHGAGGHSGALWPLVEVLARRGLDVSAVDLPLYGRTETPRPEDVRYGDWVRLLRDLIVAEDDGRPLVLFGASIGGMLACEAATGADGRVAAVVATCLLDPRDRRARARMTRFGSWGVLAGPLSSLVRGRSAAVMIRVGTIANLAKMSRDAELSKLCASDPLGGGAKVPLGFLASYLRYRHVAPEALQVPVTLAHPDEDAWTPPALSVRALRGFSAPTRFVPLPECGHFPVEEPGVSLLLRTIATTMEEVGI